jgi:hypothetical protein
MQVRMMEQVLAPGVEHSEKANLGAEVLGISADSNKVSAAALNKMP